MKKCILNKLFIPFVSLVLIFSTGCTKNELSDSRALKANAEEADGRGLDMFTPTPEGGGSFSATRWVVADNFQISERLDVNVHDIQIEVKIWADQTSGQHCSLQVPVDNDFVIIGGGARIRSMDANAPDININAALTAMHPVDDGYYNKYTASSKDHEVPYPHRLVVYAVGLKVYYYSASSGSYIPFPASSIRSLLRMVHVSAPFQNGEQLTATLPSQAPGQHLYEVLCGGSRLTWPAGESGLLLTQAGEASHQIARTKGKDHGLTTLGGTMETFLLYMVNQNPQNPSIPLVMTTSGSGTLYMDPRDTEDNFFTAVTQSHQTMYQHVLRNQALVGGKYLLASVGGDVTYTGFGRLIYALYPIDGAKAEFSTKDHLQTDISGNMHLTIYGIKPAHFQNGYQGF